MSDEIFYDNSNESAKYPIVILQGTPLYPEIFTLNGDVYKSEINESVMKCGRCAFDDNVLCGKAPRCDKGTGVSTWKIGPHGKINKNASAFHGSTQYELYFVPYIVPIQIDTIEVHEVEI